MHCSLLHLLGLIHQTPGETKDEIDAAQKDVQLSAFGSPIASSYTSILTIYMPLGNIMYNIDGFGVAWYTTARAEFEPDFTQGPRPAMYKTVAPV